MSKKGSPHKIQATQKYCINTIKKSKQLYSIKFFQENIKDLKNMLRGIKEIISSNNSNHIFPTAITFNTGIITNPPDIGNAFNNYFAKVAIDIQSSIKFYKKKYYDYLQSLNIESDSTPNRTPNLELQLTVLKFPTLSLP